MIKMLQYKMYPAGELRCPLTALVYLFIYFFFNQELCELIRTDLVLEGKEMEQLRFLDIGCGSGAISLYLLKQLPQVIQP